MKVVRQTSEKGDTKDPQHVGLSFSSIDLCCFCSPSGAFLPCVSVCILSFPTESSRGPRAVD